MLREGGEAFDGKPRSEETIRGHLAHLKAALKWAEEMGMVRKASKIQRPKRTKSQKLMKGRPIAREQFERVFNKAEAVLGDKSAASWRYLLEGLWLSGLRLGEALELYWDRWDRLCIDLDGKHPMIHIPAALDKGNSERLLPMAPEFSEFLMETPDEERTGRVFDPRSKTGCRMRPDQTSKAITAIGKKAGVKVHEDVRSGKVKFASAHNLRRSFGDRWSRRVMPQVLMELMRHESMDTTLKYYVGRNAQSTAGVLWEVHKAARGNKVSNKRLNNPPKATAESTQVLTLKAVPPRGVEPLSSD